MVSLPLGLEVRAPELLGTGLLERQQPRVGAIAHVRQRHYLVERVTMGPEPGHATRVDLVSLDHSAGRPLSVLWELEHDARILPADDASLPASSRLASPRHFAAHLRTLRWHAVTATRTDLFQAPFRAGIRLLAHQLVPLERALALPRVNLFIADDVGLGKTIEAGLVVQELTLRQRIDFVLIVCPAGLCVQWRREMQQRFGLAFTLFDRTFVADRRQERGFGVQPWSTRSRFIISYQMLRRPEHFDLLVQHLGPRLHRSLLLLDEAHTAAPAGAGHYAVDSHTTQRIRDLAPRFEHRLFLSATPHNGHSSSFSALMELLDPQRFARGVPIEANSLALAQVMVRRLKRDLSAEASAGFPQRCVVPCVLHGQHPELRLSEQLAAYTQAIRPEAGASLVTLQLEKRLLSSVEAFYRTLLVHEQNGQARDGSAFKEMAELAAQLRDQPDGKVRFLSDWIGQHLCPLGVDGTRTWNTRRVLIFTEFVDTQRYLVQQLGAAFADTAAAAERIVVLHGVLADPQREQVQQQFTGSPEQYPARILIATDAAREGLNLQTECADLFHFDIPWNPARLEQRNGRIDRALQPAAQVRCHYFVYAERAADMVLQKIIEKVETIAAELGALGQVVLHREDAADTVDTLSPEIPAARQERATTERVREILERSSACLQLTPARLREAVDAGLDLAGLGGLQPSTRLKGAYEWPAGSAKEPQKPVTFEPTIGSERECTHLHLAHPLVVRALAQLDGARVPRAVALAVSGERKARRVAISRVSLFGENAQRLHEELVGVVVPSAEPKGAVVTQADGFLEMLDAAFAGAEQLPIVSLTLQAQLARQAPADFAALWPTLRARGKEQLAAARHRLAERGQNEARALGEILQTQKSRIEEVLAETPLWLEQLSAEERQQWQADRVHLRRRLAAISAELEAEPAAIERQYNVVLERQEAIGIAYLCPDGEYVEARHG
jgi:hypothetical protein